MVVFAVCFSFLLFTSVYCSDGGDCDGSDDYGLNCQEEEINTFEGDMLGFENLMDTLRLNPNTEDFQDNALTDENKKWVNGTVYYKISNLFSCNERCIIHEAMHEMERKTCLNFIEDDQRSDFISLLPNGKCASYVGRQGNEQQLYLSPECAAEVGYVIHELMHAIGFLHEQSRKDRDDFININWDNIPELYHPQFIKHGLNNVTMHGLPYDHQSVMHYKSDAFAYDPTVMTITGKQGQEIGQRKHMSDLDVRRINIHYNCTEKTIGCHDIISNCSSQLDLRSSCRTEQFLKMCRRTCGKCNKRHNERETHSNDHCKTATQRCSKLTQGSHCPSSTSFRKIRRKTCYQSCDTCVD